jgi:hypothetical protein
VQGFSIPYRHPQLAFPMLTRKLGCRLPRRLRELLGEDATFRVELERFRTELRQVFVVVTAAMVALAPARVSLEAGDIGVASFATEPV